MVWVLLAASVFRSGCLPSVFLPWSPVTVRFDAWMETCPSAHSVRARGGGCEDTGCGCPTSSWRGSPAAWSEELVRVAAVALRVLAGNERRGRYWMANAAVVATLLAAGGTVIEVAARAEHRSDLVRPVSTLHRVSAAHSRRR
jgi:hypothetical protein